MLNSIQMIVITPCQNSQIMIGLKSQMEKTQVWQQFLKWGTIQTTWISKICIWERVNSIQCSMDPLIIGNHNQWYISKSLLSSLITRNFLTSWKYWKKSANVAKTYTKSHNWTRKSEWCMRNFTDNTETTAKILKIGKKYLPGSWSTNNHN